MSRLSMIPNAEAAIRTAMTTATMMMTVFMPCGMGINVTRAQAMTPMTANQIRNPMIDMVPPYAPDVGRVDGV